MNIVVRNVDDAVFRKLKSKAVDEGVSVGRALNQAMLEWVTRLQSANKKPALLDFKPIRCGPGNEKVSLEIDQIVYGVER